MQLEKFGEEATIVVSEEGKFHPMRIDICTPDTLMYAGMVDTQKVLEEQIAILQKRVAVYVAQQLGAWANTMSQAGKLTSKKKFDKQAPLDSFGSDTGVRVSHYAPSGNMSIQIWLPDGIVVEPSQQIEVLKAQFNKLRERLVAQVRETCGVYMDAVNIQPTEVKLDELGLDLEINIG